MLYFIKYTNDNINNNQGRKIFMAEKYKKNVFNYYYNTLQDNFKIQHCKSRTFVYA